MGKIKADEYFNNGIFEVARCGKQVFGKNLMTPTQNKKYIEIIKSKYEERKNQINEAVLKIISKVTECDPIQLLMFSTDVFLLSSLGVSSEVQTTGDNLGTTRMAEYIQSILVSSPNNYHKPIVQTDPSREYYEIQKDIETLYELIQDFYLSWGLSLKDQHPEWDDKLIDTVMESQLLFTVRGQRYQIFEIEYIDKLLSVHEEILNRLFSLTSKNIVDGMKKLQYSLSQAKADAMNKMIQLFDDYSETDFDIAEQCFQAHSIDKDKIREELFGVELYNVIKVTDWSELLVSELSYEINEEKNYLSNHEYAGWPVIDLPIQKRPFIKINGQYYCFDYYSLFDNFYRSIQKTISRIDPKYDWARHQQVASERMTEDVFLALLPGCTTYLENYYPHNGSSKKMAENDLLVLYFDTLFIIEVKAGSFVYTPPLTDFDAHIRSYKTLIEKADWQCERVYDYLTSTSNSVIYDKQNNKKAQLDMTRITDIFTISVTMDNINDFAARAEKLSFLKLKSKAISISIDDLMVYREYFNSPLYFLHFLRQRKLATQEEKIALNDELDHLGMYIAHNCYTYQTHDISKNIKMNWFGYREDLDKYFATLYQPQLNFPKPVQNIPEFFQEILAYLNNSILENKVEVSNYLLDFSTEAKTGLCEQVQHAIDRQTQIHSMVSIHSGGTGKSLRYSCFVNQPGVKSYSEIEKRKYALSTLVRNQEDNRVVLEFYYDNDGDFKSITYKRYTPADVRTDEKEDLLTFGNDLANYRMDNYIQSHSEKIGQNQRCPCGSGKKYKKCCFPNYGN